MIRVPSLIGLSRKKSSWKGDLYGFIFQRFIHGHLALMVENNLNKYMINIAEESCIRAEIGHHTLQAFPATNSSYVLESASVRGEALRYNNT
ncbi:hypothetical protein TSUD_263380 [Trifolium subterraneum]|uniref:Uncharacterized protein n=1 Tax=Trifolium subterraneum TaxID=3900 RepID=A0A2Z6NWE9_TRISU|nr:hypothetical protein TSUD_263380 [Trifolium subterraneum]